MKINDESILSAKGRTVERVVISKFSDRDIIGIEIWLSKGEKDDRMKLIIGPNDLRSPISVMTVREWCPDSESVMVLDKEDGKND